MRSYSGAGAGGRVAGLGRQPAAAVMPPRHPRLRNEARPGRREARSGEGPGRRNIGRRGKRAWGRALVGEVMASETRGGQAGLRRRRGGVGKGGGGGGGGGDSCACARVLRGDSRPEESPLLSAPPRPRLHSPLRPSGSPPRPGPRCPETARRRAGSTPAQASRSRLLTRPVGPKALPRPHWRLICGRSPHGAAGVAVASLGSRGLDMGRRDAPAPASPTA